jgi:DNA-binding NtrC family response regulator
VSVDVRVIAATNVDLKTLVDNGVFRRDLYYRLNVFPIYVPPLRERKEDIPLLVELFLKQLNSYHMKNIKGMDPRVLEALEWYDWPGNIRELENVMERAYILEKGDTLSPQSFPREIMAGHETKPLYIIGSSTLKEVRRQAVEEAEKRYIEDLLKLNGGRIDKSAFAAGVTTRQFRKLMRRYGLRKEQFKMMRKRVRPQAIPEQAQGPLF